ncbi:MAG TPA: TIGR04551 family protein [Polyangiaceae bacterium]|nr:TIGR04551 family protein [Polyangiaceae bacterium]
MRKTSLIVALAAGLARAVGTPGLASAQQPGAAPAEPPAPEAAPTPPPPSDAAPDDRAPEEPAAEPPAASAPLDSAEAPRSLGERSLFPNPSLDSENLKRQGEERPDARHQGGTVTLEGIFAEDWWSHARPIFEFHGYFRTRSTLFYNFALGRRDPPSTALYPQPTDNQYTTVVGNMPGSVVGPILCREDETDAAPTSAGTPLRPCRNKTQAGANLRFRLNPELHISDNLRVMTQIDILDNVVLGSNPEGYALSPSSTGGYAVLPRSGYLPNGYLDTTQAPPRSGVNSLQDTISVKRAWAEFTTPLGEARFGRMPNNWGLGMLYNAGDGYDDDAQSTVDRIMFATGIKLIDLVIAGMWDFPNEGPTTGLPYAGGEQYDRGGMDDVNQYGLMILRRKSPELTKLELSRGNLVFNTGLYVNYRTQTLANDQPGSGNVGANVPGADPATLSNQGYARRGLNMWVPDLWLQLLYKKLRVEAEVASVLGSVESTQVTPNGDNFVGGGGQDKRKLNQWGFAFELQQKLVEDRLRLNFKTGWASGDPDAFDPDAAGNLIPGPNEDQVNDNTISTFRFHPTYRVDNILNRYILQRVQGTYYFNPSLEYDFSRQPNGQRIGGGIYATWTRASQFVQTPGHADDLGLELGGSLYFQSKDGAINDDPARVGGFFGQLQYSVLFPLDGLGYQAVPRQGLGLDTSAAQMLRLYLGVMF